MSDMDHMVKVYVDEAGELLEELERALLELEGDPTNHDRIDACFRVMHTLKGGAGMFGFEEIARFTHDVESVYDRVRSGQLSVSNDLLTLTLRARDHILALLEIPTGELDNTLREATDALLKEFAVYRDVAHSEGQSSLAAVVPFSEDSGVGDTSVYTRADDTLDHFAIYWIRFRPDADILQSGNDPLRLMAELDEKGLLRVQHNGQLPPPLGDKAYDPEQVYGYYDALLLTMQDINAIRDVFLFVESGNNLKVALIHDGIMRGSDLSELLKLLSGVDDDERAAMLLTQGCADISAQIQAAKAKTSAHMVDAAAKAPAAKRVEAGGSSSLRVDSSKLDVLVNMAGEMLILQSRLRQAVKAKDMDAVAAVDEDLERLTDDMREVSLGLRMLPISTVFNVFQRLVRDLGNTLAKEVDFITIGGETELDKTILDQLKDPLVHILRNSMDHGIESPAVREAEGKPRRGAITLSASHGGGSVEIVVADNGRGIDTETVRRKAIERGLLSADAEISEKELLNIIFAPGFSTASQVSDVSGRGVGMDVVMRNITDLRGTVDIESTKGQGSRVIIRLPLTLAIIDGFNVVVGRETFIVPLSHLRGFQERFVAAPTNKVETVERMGELIPLVSLRRIFNVPGDQPSYERIVITEVDGEKVGFCVDKVVGRQQAVIKSLDDCYRNITWISGTTINGDGSISLILDIPRLVRMARDSA